MQTRALENARRLLSTPINGARTPGTPPSSAESGASARATVAALQVGCRRHDLCLSL
jgi:hypothetical protein